MPELPEVEWMSRDLHARAAGRRVVGIELDDPRLLRGADDAVAPVGTCDGLEGATLVGVRRRGKISRALWDTRDGSRELLVHFRMTGRWAWEPGARGRARIHFDSGLCATFVDPRRFGRWQWVTPDEADAILAGVGPEPWPAPLSGPALAARFEGTRRALKPLLMEPARVAGLGNIAASEVLHRAGIHPDASPGSLDADAWDGLARSIVAFVDETLAWADANARIEWMNDGHAPEASGFRVYGRDGLPCTTCGAPVRCSRQGGRSTFWCGACQTPPEGLPSGARTR